MVAELDTGMAGMDRLCRHAGPGKEERQRCGLGRGCAGRMSVYAARTGMIDMGNVDRMIEGMGEHERLHAQQCEHHERTT